MTQFRDRIVVVFSAVVFVAAAVAFCFVGRNNQLHKDEGEIIGGFLRSCFVLEFENDQVECC